MLNIYFCDLTHTGLGINAHTFPLGLGTVASYLIKEMNGSVKCKLFKFPDELNDALKQEIPDVLCMSYYSWNASLSYAFAKYVKEKHPKTLVVFGGPNFSHEKKKRKSFLRKFSAIDFYIKWDGEYALTDLIQRYINSGLNIINLKSSNFIADNICYILHDEYIEGNDQRVIDLPSIPSPYLTGLFDQFFNYPLTPVIETNRGCPYSCTFCNDGHTLRNAIANKDPEIFEEELKYIALKSNLPAHYNVLISDLNFGMFKHDLTTSEIFKSIIKKYDWPNRIECSMGKSQPKRLVEVANIINEAKPGIFKLAPSFQTTDIDVLKNVKRKNISMDQLIDMRSWLDQDTIVEFFTEIILALPGDSIEKHYKTLEDCIDKLHMNNIDIHQLTILKGSEMETSVYRDMHELTSKYRVYVGCIGFYKIGEKEIPCAEIEEIVVKNKTLSFDDYVECRVMDLLVKIYITGDLFREIFGIIRKNNLSVFNILLLLKNQILSNYPSLTNLVNSFVECTKDPLFDSYEELESFVLNVDNLKGYISGKYGQNELITHRAKAYIENLDDLFDALKDATVLYLKNEGALTSDLNDYFNEAVAIGKLRKFNFNNYNNILEKEISFDFIRADNDGFLIDPVNLKINRKKIKLYFDDSQKINIDDMIKRYGVSSLHEKGKFYQKGNSMLLNRRMSYK